MINGIDAQSNEGRAIQLKQLHACDVLIWHVNEHAYMISDIVYAWRIMLHAHEFSAYMLLEHICVIGENALVTYPVEHGSIASRFTSIFRIRILLFVRSADVTRHFC